MGAANPHAHLLGLGVGGSVCRAGSGPASGATDPAGALIDGQTVARAVALGLDPAAFLSDNNSTEFFEVLKDLLNPGPTFTNVNDFRAIVVDRS